MLRFSQMKALQRLASVYANVRNHFSWSATSPIDRPIRKAAQPPWLSGSFS